MRCPSCDADQPDGVTICGFCGSVMVAPAETEPSVPAGLAAAAAPERSGGWMLVGGLLFVLLGGALFAWREVRRYDEPPAEPAATVTAPADVEPAPRARATRRPTSRAVPPATRRLDPGDLWSLADALELLTAEGDSLELARRLDAGLGYRSEVVDVGEVRRLDGGRPELLAHWLTPLWIERVEGLDAGAGPETVAVEIDSDGRSGTIERSLDSPVEPSRLDFPVPLLLRLARGIPVSTEDLSGLDLRPALRATTPCHVDERLRVAFTREGLRVVEVDRGGRCGI